MNPSSSNLYKNHRFPAEIISHAVWLYFRFCLSYRDVEELLFARGVIVTYEAIRKWCLKFGQTYANQLRRRRPRPGDKWHIPPNYVVEDATAQRKPPEVGICRLRNQSPVGNRPPSTSTPHWPACWARR
jgi:hypothetical protein